MATVAVPFIGVFELVILLFLSWGTTPFPLGVPPLPEDPVLAKVAPNEVLFYLRWNGTGEPDPESTNHTEKLFAAPEIRNLVKRIEQELTLAFKREARGAEGVIVEELPKLLKTILTRPTAVFLSDFDMDGQVVNMEGALVVHLGEGSASIRRSLESVERFVWRQVGQDPRDLPDPQSGIRKLPLPPEAPPAGWGIEGDYVFIAIGRNTTDTIRGRLQASLREDSAVPSWLATSKKQLVIERPSSLTYFNVKSIVQVVQAVANAQAGEGAAVQKFLRALGLDAVTSFASASGLDASSCVTKSLIALDGAPRGLLTPLAGPPLRVEDVSKPPADSTFAMALRLDLAKLYEEVVRSLDEIDPSMRSAVAEGVREVETELGFLLVEDLLKPLGDRWCVYNSPGDGGLLITGLTAVVSVRDADAFRSTLDRLAAAMNTELNRSTSRRRRYEFRELSHEGSRIHFINPVGDDWVVAPAWCLTDREFVIAPYPQMVKAYLSREKRGADTSLARKPEVARLFREGQQPIAVSYVDIPELVRLGYPLLHGLATVACAELQSEGIRLDVSLLPGASTLLRHLQPSTGAVYRTTDGIVLESREALPLSGLTTILTAVLPLIR